MILNDPKINNGLPEGMSLKDLVCGTIIEVKWLEEPNFTKGMIIEIEKRQSTFLGEFRLYLFNGSEQIHVFNTQIVRLVKDKSHFLALLKD